MEEKKTNTALDLAAAPPTLVTRVKHYSFNMLIKKLLLALIAIYRIILCNSFTLRQPISVAVSYFIIFYISY